MARFHRDRIADRFGWEVDRLDLQTHEERKQLVVQRVRKPAGDRLRPLLPPEKVLVENNLRLVLLVATWYRDDSVIPFCELIQIGAIGLMFAAECWEPEIATFSTYAVIRIRAEVYRAMFEARKNRGIKVSAYARERHHRLHRLGAHLEQEFGRPATAEEVAAHSGMQAKSFERLYNLPQADSVERTGRFKSNTMLDGGLGQEVGDDSNNQLGNNVASRDSDPEAQAILQELCQVMRGVLATLKSNEEFVLRERYGFDDDEKTLDEVGAEMDVTRERIRQIETKALRKLRHHSRARRLRPFI